MHARRGQPVLCARQPLPVALHMGASWRLEPRPLGHRGTHNRDPQSLSIPRRRNGRNAGPGPNLLKQRGPRTRGRSYRTRCSCGTRPGSRGPWASPPGAQARLPRWGGRGPAGCPRPCGSRHPCGSRRHRHVVLTLDGGGWALGRHTKPVALRVVTPLKATVVQPQAQCCVHVSGPRYLQPHPVRRMVSPRLACGSAHSAHTCSGAGPAAIRQETPPHSQASLRGLSGERGRGHGRVPLLWVLEAGGPQCSR